jgi:hypothetical protein
VSWNCFELEVIGVNEDGRPKKKVKECFKETSSSTFLEYLRPKIQLFVKHNFVARWQNAQCKIFMDVLPRDTILSHINFAENYTFEIQNEI